MYKVCCVECDEMFSITMEERDLLDDDDYVCDQCYSKDPEPEPDRCRCDVYYGMRKSYHGPGYFQDADPGVITDTSCCPIHCDITKQ